MSTSTNFTQNIGTHPDGTLAPPRFQDGIGASRWAVGTAQQVPSYMQGPTNDGVGYNTAPVAASPTTPGPGSPQYGFQQSPNYGDASTSAPAPVGPFQWSVEDWTYVWMADGQGTVQIAKPASRAGTMVRPGQTGYTAILQEYAQKIGPADPSRYNTITSWLAQAKTIEGTRGSPTPPPPGSKVDETALAQVPESRPSLWTKIKGWFGIQPSVADAAPVPNHKPWGLLAGAALVLGATAAGAWWFWRARR